MTESKDGEQGRYLGMKFGDEFKLRGRQGRHGDLERRTGTKPRRRAIEIALVQLHELYVKATERYLTEDNSTGSMGAHFIPSSSM